MSLGLDLRGGVHFLLEVDMDAVIATSINRYENELRSLLKKDRLYRKILKENNFLVVKFKEQNLKDQAKKVIRDELPDLMIVQGSESELQLSLEVTANAQSVSKKERTKNRTLRHCVIV